MTKEQLQTIADLVAIAHDEYDGCPSYRDDLERYDRVLAEIKAEAQPAPGNAAGATAPEPLSAALAETRKSLADDSWIDEITALDEDGEPDDFARRVVPLDDALEAIDRIEAAAERKRHPGNAAALREALEEQSRYWWSHIRNYFENEMLKRTDAALSAPARNCDIGTAEEQAERHGRFCAAHYKADAVDAQCFGCPASDKKETDCEFVWGQLPFAPAEGGPHA